MSASVWPSGNAPSPKPVLIFIVLSVVAAGALMVAVNAHAIARHGTAVTTASECFDHNTPSLNMIRPSDSRNASVCYDGSQYHVYITAENGDPITIFTKEKMKSLDQVVRYLCNAGYIPTVPAFSCSIP